MRVRDWRDAVGMNTELPVPRTRRRGQDEIDALVYTYHASGMSVPDFSVQEGVASSSLYKWLRRERADSDDGIVEAPWLGGGCLTLCFPAGLRLQIPCDAPERAVGRVLAAVEARR